MRFHSEDNETPRNGWVYPKLRLPMSQIENTSPSSFKFFLVHSFVHSLRIFLQVHYYSVSEALPTVALILCRSKHTEALQTSASEGRSLRGGWSEIRASDPPDARHRTERPLTQRSRLDE